MGLIEKRSTAANKDPLTVVDVDARVRECLDQMKLTYRNSDSGRYMVPAGSSMVVVGVHEIDSVERPNSVVIRMYAVVATDVPVSPQLYRYVALKNEQFIFGALGAAEEDDKATVYLNYALLGDYLDALEFQTALIMLGGSADSLDDDLVMSFEGRKTFA